MAIRKFQRDDLRKYYFDTSADCVMSLQTGDPRRMKWVTPYPGSPRRVSMVTDRGFKVSYRYDQIMDMLRPVDVAVDRANNTDLSTIKPTVDYVLFSTKNRCSQYFFANTSIQEALDRLARRGERVAPEDVRILDTVTGRVQLLGIKTITTYTLV